MKSLVLSLIIGLFLAYIVLFYKAIILRRSAVDLSEQNKVRIKNLVKSATFLCGIAFVLIIVYVSM